MSRHLAPLYLGFRHVAGQSRVDSAVRLTTVVSASHQHRGGDENGRRDSNNRPRSRCLADATGFDAEIRALRDRGHTAIGFGNPLRICWRRRLSSRVPPHPQRSNRARRPLDMAAIYLNRRDRQRSGSGARLFHGWMCDEGESQQLLLEKFEGSLVGPSIRPVPFTNPDGSEGTDLYLAPEAFREAFAADVDPETAAVMAAAQRPYAAAAFAATPSAPPAWNTLPCWYLLGTEDKAIPPELQRFMAERANATIVEVPASHVSFVSQPQAATQLILQAVEATG